MRDRDHLSVESGLVLARERLERAPMVLVLHAIKNPTADAVVELPQPRRAQKRRMSHARSCRPSVKALAYSFSFPVRRGLPQCSSRRRVLMAFLRLRLRITLERHPRGRRPPVASLPALHVLNALATISSVYQSTRALASLAVQRCSPSHRASYYATSCRDTPSHTSSTVRPPSVRSSSQETMHPSIGAIRSARGSFPSLYYAQQSTERMIRPRSSRAATGRAPSLFQTSATLQL